MQTINESKKALNKEANILTKEQESKLLGGIKSEFGIDSPDLKPSILKFAADLPEWAHGSRTELV